MANKVFEDYFDEDCQSFKKYVEKYKNKRDLTEVEASVNIGYDSAIVGQLSLKNEIKKNDKDHKFKDELINNVACELEKIIKNPPKGEKEFDDAHKKLRKLVMDNFENYPNLKTFFDEREGYGQKIINVALKCLYSLDRSRTWIEEYGHFVIDSFTLKFALGYLVKCDKKNRNFKKNFEKAWTKMSDKQYEELMDKLKKGFASGSNLEYSLGKDKVVLPKSLVKAEFVVWHQEKLNKIVIYENEIDRVRLKKGDRY